MKKLYFILLLVIISECKSATLYAIVNNGFWNSNSTWSTTDGGFTCGCKPRSGDDVIIPSGITVSLNGNMSTSITSLTVRSGGKLEGSNKEFNEVVDLVTVNAGGIIDNIKKMNEITFSIVNEGTINVNEKIKWKGVAAGVEVLNNSGTLRAEKIEEGLGFYPIPVGTASLYTTFQNSGVIYADKLQMDGYFTNTVSGEMYITTGNAEVHVDGLLCNYNIIEAGKLKLHGGKSDCGGNYIIDEIAFDNEDKQTGSDQNGTLSSGSYCSSIGLSPIFTNINDSDIDSTVVFYCNVALPVEWLALDVYTRESTIVVAWSTSSEFNNNYFVVEGSLDAEYFEEIGTLQVDDGVTETGNSYELAIEDKSFLYYRVVQVDLNGEFSISKVLYNQYYFSQEKFKIKSNVVTGALKLQFDGRDSGYVELLNINGVVFDVFYKGIGERILEIDVTALDEGLYFIRVGDDVDKFVKL